MCNISELQVLSFPACSFTLSCVLFLFSFLKDLFLSVSRCDVCFLLCSPPCYCLHVFQLHPVTFPALTSLTISTLLLSLSICAPLIISQHPTTSFSKLCEPHSHAHVHIPPFHSDSSPAVFVSHVLAHVNSHCGFLLLGPVLRFGLIVIHLLC